MADEIRKESENKNEETGFILDDEDMENVSGGLFAGYADVAFDFGENKKP